MKFDPIPETARTVPHALKVKTSPGQEQRYLRLTHQFTGLFYGMWVTSASAVRTAGRPFPVTVTVLAELEAEGAVWGRLSPPDDLLKPRAQDEPSATDGAWRIIAPLVANFSVERNLSRQLFSSLIRERAKETQTNEKTVHRLIRRYYYFGQVRDALAMLPPGRQPSIKTLKPPSPKESPSSDNETSGKSKRAGAKSSLEKTYGPNTFVVTDDDIYDMVNCLRRLSKRGRTSVKDAYEHYLGNDFKARNPEVFQLYQNKLHPAPVSIGQYRRYTNEYLILDKDISRNLRTKASGRSSGQSLDSLGPADIYEIDATYGRIVLTTSEDTGERRLIATPTIYLIIDRWSRYVVSIYVSLKAPSWDEVRYALLIAFTSRAKRFQALGIDVDDKRWPVGRIPAILRRDRGTELVGDSMEIAVGDLRIEPSTLPPRTPNGKSIVERFIRTMKAWMARRIPGAYAERPTNYHAKRDAKAAKRLAIYSLSELYRELVEFIVEYNNSPHSSLKRIQALAADGVKPTPQAAYIWGVKNLTGARVSTFTDEQLQQMILGKDRGSISTGELRYRGYRYKPANAPAMRMITKSSGKTKSIDIRVDKTFPFEVFCEARPEWARFEMYTADRAALGMSSMDEAEARKPIINEDVRRDEHDQTHARVTASKRVKKQPFEVDRTTPSQGRLASDRREETTDLKAKMTGKSKASPTEKVAPHTEPEWKVRARKIREEETLRIAAQKVSTGEVDEIPETGPKER